MYCSIENVMPSRRDAIVDVAHGRCPKNVSYDTNSILPSVDETVASHIAAEDSAKHPGSGHAFGKEIHGLLFNTLFCCDKWQCRIMAAVCTGNASANRSIAAL